MCIFAVIIYAVFAQAGAIPQNPQAEATRAWLDRHTVGGDNAAAMEAARRAILEQKREDARALERFRAGG